MGRILRILALLVIVAGAAAAFYVRTHPDTPWSQQVMDVVEQGQQRAAALGKRVASFRKAGDERQGRRASPSPAIAKQTRLYLKNGDWVTGELVRENPTEVVLRWDYGEVPFARGEILRLVTVSDDSSALAATATATPEGLPAAEAAKTVTLYLANGGVVSGALIHDMPEQVVLRFDYGEVAFQRREIQRMERSDQSIPGAEAMVMPWEGKGHEAVWPYHHEVVVKLMKGAVVDGRLTTVTPETVEVTQTLEQGGDH